MTAEDPWKNTVLLHNGSHHNLSTMLAQAASNPDVTLNLDQIGPVPGDDMPVNLFLIQPSHQDIDHLPLVLYKYQGRYHVLVGKATVTQARTNKQTAVRGKLLSSPALKKARIAKEETAPSQSFNSNTPPAKPPVSDHRKGRPTGNRY